MGYLSIDARETFSVVVHGWFGDLSAGVGTYNFNNLILLALRGHVFARIHIGELSEGGKDTMRIDRFLFQRRRRDGDKQKLNPTDCGFRRPHPCSQILSTLLIIIASLAPPSLAWPTLYLPPRSSSSQQQRLVHK